MSTLELFKFNVAPLTKTIGASNKIRFSNKICNIFHMQHGLEHPYESMCGMWTVCAIAPSAENVKLTKWTSCMVIMGRMWKPFLRVCFFLVSHTLPSLETGRSRRIHWQSKHLILRICELWQPQLESIISTLGVAKPRLEEKTGRNNTSETNWSFALGRVGKQTEPDLSVTVECYPC